MSEVGREVWKNGRQSRHVRQSVCRACCLSQGQGHGTDDGSDWVRTGGEMDRWSKSKCLLGRRLEAICDSLERSKLGGRSEIGFWEEMVRHRLGKTESGVRKSVHNRPMVGELVDGASMGLRSGAGEEREMR